MKTEILHTEQDTLSNLWQLIGESVAILWKDWPIDMEVSIYDAGNRDKSPEFTLRGRCPHCLRDAVFTQVTSACVESGRPSTGTARWVSGLQCQGCLSYILATVVYDPNRLKSPSILRYETHYPLGKPNETLGPGIPPDVATDFVEAIRCQSVEAYRACVVMCRRAVQTSVIEKNAQGNTLVKQIEDLAAKGIITASLKDVAHEIRLTGNAGAHVDGLEDVKEEDASAIVEFTRQYLDYVYVMPERLKARRPQAKAGTANP